MFAKIIKTKFLYEYIIIVIKKEYFRTYIIKAADLFFTYFNHKPSNAAKRFVSQSLR